MEKKEKTSQKAASLKSHLDFALVSVFSISSLAAKKTMENAALSERPPPLPAEPPETVRKVAGTSEGSEKRDGREKSDGIMPDADADASSSPTLMNHAHLLRRLLLLLALAATQLLSVLGFALRWLGHTLEDLAGVFVRERKRKSETEQREMLERGDSTTKKPHPQKKNLHFPPSYFAPQPPRAPPRRARTELQLVQ